MPVVVVCPKDNHYEKVLSNMQEVKAREGQLIAISTQGDADVARICIGEGSAPPSRRGSYPPPALDPDVVTVPVAEQEVLPLLTVLPLQLLAYYMADLKGTDVDQPRNLAKTVTVE
jgi:glucosamine--fructose-6-phosphate aminotransferase (isomerizing)